MKKRWSVEDARVHKRTYDLVSDFVRRFKSRNKSIMCPELLGCDISTPDGLHSAGRQNVFAMVCPGYARDATEMLEQVLEI